MSAVILEGCAGAVKILKCGCDQCSAMNVNDVQIAQTICGTIVLVAFIMVVGFLVWKLMEYIANGVSGYSKRKWEEKDCVKKQKSDLQDKLLNFLEKNTSKEECSKEEGKMVKKQKSFDSKESQYYIDVLTALIKGDDVSAYLKEIKTDENKES
jgi:hypothetical protein